MMMMMMVFDDDRWCMVDDGLYMIDSTGETEAHRRPDGHDGTSPAYSVMMMMMMMRRMVMMMMRFFVFVFLYNQLTSSCHRTNIRLTRRVAQHLGDTV